MKYAFTDFVFDSEQLILYKNNEVVACRNNEAKLLVLLLNEPQRVFSKDEILQQVWSGKVVSEQAVFQNISLLRALFGEDAIKTFSKKGYQWQLATTPYIEPVVVPITRQPSVVVSAPFRRSLWVSLALVLVSVGYLYWRSVEVDSRLIRVALLPLLIDVKDQGNQGLNGELLQPAWQAINRANIYHPVVVSDLKDYDDFFSTPQKYFTQLSLQTHSGVVMAAKVGTHKGKFRINYLLKSERSVWGAGHEAGSVVELMEKMNAHIALILQSEILDVDFSDSALRKAKLKILHHQAPDDFIIGTQLVRNEMQTGDWSNAVLLADEMVNIAQRQGDVNGGAQSYVVMAETYVMQGLYENAEHALQKASDIFQAERDPAALATMQRSYASLAFAKHDYPFFKQSMITAMQFAKEAQDPLLEVSFSNYLSVVAHKFGEKMDRQAYLEHSEAILDQTHQSREHYGSIYFYAGMYADSEALAEKNYRKVLAVLPADQEWWERQTAQEHLTDILIKQDRWREALESFPKDKTLNASEELMLLKIYSAQQDWQNAEAHGLSAFKIASLNGQISAALDAALALLDIYQQVVKPESARIYEQFLTANARNVPYWIRFHKTELDKHGLELQGPDYDAKR